MSLQDLLKTFSEKIEFVRRSSMGLPKSFNIDLGTAERDREFGLAGNFFYILHAPDDTVYVDIKINGTNETPIHMTRALGFITPFDKLYITTPPGQIGTITIVYGTESPQLLELIDNRSSTSLGINQIVAELQGDVTPENWGEVMVGTTAVLVVAANVDRKACWIHADTANTSDVYLGFTNGVTTRAGGNMWFAVLEPGDGWGVDDYRGDIYAIADGAGQQVGMGEW